MKTLRFLGVTGALFAASCQQMQQYQQVTLLGREDLLRAPNHKYQQVVIFGDDGAGSHVAVKEFATKAEARKDAKEHPIGETQRIVGWNEDRYPLESVGGGNAVLYMGNYPKVEREKE